MFQPDAARRPAFCSAVLFSGCAFAIIQTEVKTVGKKETDLLAYTLATHTIERLTPSREAMHCCKRIIQGELTGDEAVQEVLKQHGVSVKRHE
jgi:hypothetical protein